jgi:Subtilase family
VFVEFCRATYSNYGAYVNITAPGTDIYSTTPYKKEFYGARYFGDDLNGYNTYQGTSMASPHVAAVAARVWGTFPTYLNTVVFDRVASRGIPALVGTPIDIDDDNIDDLAECWESGFEPVGIGPGYLVETNVATTLGRGRVTGRLFDATTGLGLTAATASVAKGITPVGFGGGVDFVGASFYDIINVPWNDDGSGAQPTDAYRLRVSRAGYTLGVQVVDNPSAGGVGVFVGPSPVDPTLFDPGSPEKAVPNVGVPPLTANYTFVTDWGSVDFFDLGITTTELDSYLWLPSTKGPGGVGCSIGFAEISGDCGDAGSTGTLMASPFARWFRDGTPVDGLGTETTGIRPPLFATTPTDQYQYAVEDVQEANGNGFIAPDSNPVVRLWKGGVVKAVVRYANHTVDPACVPDGGATDCMWWDVGRLSGAGVFTVTNTIGDDGTVIPYQTGGGATRISIRPRSGSRSGNPSGSPRLPRVR